MAEPTGLRWPVHGTRLDTSYPYIDAEVVWACRREYACTAVDVIARRTRLSFLNAEAALEALPRVIEIMSHELGWSESERSKQFKDATTFLGSMGLSPARVGNLTIEDVKAGRHKHSLEIQDELLARTIFTPEELQGLKSKFHEMDSESPCAAWVFHCLRYLKCHSPAVDNDGKIGDEDLMQTMNKLGHGDVPRETVLSILREVDAHPDGKVDLHEFLDVA